jgi:GT2 family glycosyltransferase
MNPETPKIVVVIVNWMRPDDTIACLESIYQSSIDELACLVVDNGSTDDSVQRIKQAFPQVEWLLLPENRGFAGGYNAGIRRALETGASKIFLLNNDTIVDQRAIAALAQSGWDVAIPKIVYHQQPDRIWCAGCAWRPFPPSVVMIGFGKQANDIRYNRSYPLEYATGCAMMVSREALQLVKGFDEAFTSYMEDYDFSFRLRQHGFSMGYVPEAVVMHKVSQSLGEFSPARWKLMGRNAVFFYRLQNRFPAWKLLFFLAWVCLRESLKGNWGIVPAFISGARQGFGELKHRRRPDREEDAA